MLAVGFIAFLVFVYVLAYAIAKGSGLIGIGSFIIFIASVYCINEGCDEWMKKRKHKRR
jgi:1,4-dihydroxy-2-naphthoate octaprenyltransferase